MNNLESSLRGIVKTLCTSGRNAGNRHERLHRAADFVGIRLPRHGGTSRQEFDANAV